MSLNLLNFIESIKDAALKTEIELLNHNSKIQTELNGLLIEAIRNTQVELKNGADVWSFQDLVIVNFLIDAVMKKYNAGEIKDYIVTFNEEDD